MNWILLRAIKERGLTQRAFSRAVGDHETVVSRIVRGTWNPDPARRERYARVLNMKPEDLFGSVPKE